MFKHPKVYYWNMYAPHRVLRTFLSRKIYYWADRKYGVKARGKVDSTLNVEQKLMLKDWHKWMYIKNKIGNKI